MSEPTEIVRVAGTISQADYARAHWLNQKPRPTVMALGVLVAVLLVVASTVNIYRYTQGEINSERVALLPFLTTLLLGYFVVVVPWRLRRGYRRYTTLHAPFEIEVSKDGLYSKSKFGESRLPWEVFREVKENRHVFLLYQGDVFHIVPKRLFREADGDRLREFCTQALRPAT